MSENQWTLTEIARLLDQPQHRLIYLCEKGVIVPDISDAHGRGSSRRFSTRNVFEFSVALVLSEFYFPANISTNLLYAIRSFEDSVKANGLDNFSLPHSLMNTRSPEIIGIITNGSILYFSLGLPGMLKKVFGGVNMSDLSRNNVPSIARLNSHNATDRTEESEATTIGSNLARFEINLTKIAQNLNMG